MSNSEGTKINKLLIVQPYGTVMLSSWLADNGYSYELQQRYKKSGWLESLGTGALVRKGQRYSYQGAIYALQQQASMSVHAAGRSALALLGKAQYIPMFEQHLVLFGLPGEKLPAWFTREWNERVEYYTSSFLSTHQGMVEYDTGNFTMRVSGAARAMLECLHLTPIHQDLVECYELMEGLTNLPPKQVQHLLENCRSVKVKRLFLYLAERAKHSWFSKLDIGAIELGKGKRSIVSNGVFNQKYGITIPRELAS